MPIKIFKPGEPTEGVEEIACLCDNDWELPVQVEALEQWLEENASLTPDEYTADIGYAVRDEPCGGGGNFTISMMQILVALGMEVRFSEYPCFSND